MVLKIKQIFFVCFLCLIIPSLISATELNSLNLNDALNYALTHPRIQGKKKELNVANEKLNTSKWLRFPAVSVISSAGQSSLSSRDREPVTTIRLEQPLWAGGRISSSIEANQARLNSSIYGISEIEEDVLGKTSAVYCSLLKMQEKIEASKENVEEHKRLLSLIQRKARNEVSPMVEIVLAKTRLEQAQYEQIQLITQATNLKAELESLIGQPFQSIKNPKVALSIPSDLDQAISLTISNSPTIKRLESDVEASSADIDVSKASIWPQISARNDNIIGGITEGNISYLALTYTPGNGLSALSNTSEARAKKEVAETLIRSTTLELSNKIRADWNQYFAEMKQAEVLSNLVETSQGVYESYLRQYAVGKKTWVEVLNAKKESTQAKYIYSESQWNSFMAGVRLQISTGMIIHDSPNLK
ncbi:TolC Outer membrane protein [Candidatus Methylopumilus universalis]|uniref:TolC family protein n=1 Tax=Candidatus Methylopumilus universalis TaxID=2588536 RepID=UPI003BEEF785